MAREHLYMLIVDREGNLQEGAEVRLLQPHTLNLIAVPIYEADVGNNVIGNPFEIDSGIIDIYVDNPIRVRIGVRIGSSAEQFIEDIDIGGSGSEGEHNHNSTGEDSTAVGTGAIAAGDQSAAYGVDAASNANRSVAVGYNSTGAQADSIAIGYQVNANGDKTIVIGAESNATASGAVVLGADSEASGSQSVSISRNSTATAPNSVAIGYNSTASHSGSTALGTGASTTDDNQVMVGTSNHSVQIPGVLLMTSPGGNHYEVRVSDSGALYASHESKDTDTSILPPADQSFSGGVGGWTSTGATLSITNDADISPNSLLTIDEAQGSVTVSSEVEAADSDRLSGYAWVYASDAFAVSLTLEYMASGVADSESEPLSMPPIAEQWIKVSTQGTAPPGVDGVRLKVVTDSSTPGDVVYIEQADIQRRE